MISTTLKSNHILENIAKDSQIISIKNFKSSKESIGKSISLQNIYKIGLLSKRNSNDIEEKIKPIPVSKISFVEANKVKSHSLKDLEKFFCKERISL